MSHVSAPINSMNLRECKRSLLMLVIEHDTARRDLQGRTVHQMNDREVDRRVQEFMVHNDNLDLLVTRIEQLQDEAKDRQAQDGPVEE